MNRRRIKNPYENPGVADVRRWRAEMVKDAGGTLEGLIRLLGKPERKNRSRKTATKSGQSQRRARPRKAA